MAIHFKMTKDLSNLNMKLQLQLVKKWVLEYGQGVYKEDGQVEALEGIILDITDRKEMENPQIFEHP